MLGSVLGTITGAGGGNARTAERSCCEHGRRKGMRIDCGTGYCQRRRGAARKASSTRNGI